MILAVSTVITTTSEANASLLALILLRRLPPRRPRPMKGAATRVAPRAVAAAMGIAGNVLAPASASIILSIGGSESRNNFLRAF